MMQIKHFISGGGSKDSEAAVLLLHGYGADERDLPELMRYLTDLPWYSPRAPLAAGDGFSWYNTSNLLEPTVQELSEITKALWDWIDEIIPIEQGLILLGFSQGGLMATQLLRTRPNRIRATVILSGFLGVGELPADQELLINKPKVIYCRGSEDTRITKEAISRLNNWLQLHTKAVTKNYPALGHSVNEAVMLDVAEYVTSQLK